MAFTDNSQSSSLTDLDHEFRILADSVASHYRRFVPGVKPYHDSSLPHFSRLPTQKKQNAVHYLRQLWSVIQHDIANQVDVGNNAVALWSALKVFGFKPGSDLFGYLQGDDTIEIYTLDGIQVWRNCNLMEVCSYSLEEIHSFEWHERYDRAEVDNQNIVQTIGRMLGEGKPRHVAAMIPYHSVNEKFSESMFRLNVRHDHFFPLTLQGGNDVVAFLVTSKVDILSRKATAVPARAKTAAHLNLVD